MSRPATLEDLEQGLRKMERRLMIYTGLMMAAWIAVLVAVFAAVNSTAFG